MQRFESHKMRSAVLVTTAILQLCSRAWAAVVPTAAVLNGTYQGRYLSEWDQDAFLGIPYAQPPVGSLRFKWPQSLNGSFDEVRDATSYGYSCMQYHTAFNLSEDCLSLNVIRPSGDLKDLPVLVWIYGGGLYTGSTADPQYNLSGIVKLSQEMGQPLIAVDMNYRLNMYGFLQTPQIVAEGSSNAGLMDQRMALRWIQENIAAFGGDPERVVIWGESAGAQSIAYHLLSYDGRDDGLYRGAIMESGGPTGCQVQDLAYYTPPVENLTRTVGCWTAKDQLSCLRGLSQESLFAAAPTQVWNPLIDGDFLTGYPSQLLRAGKFNRVPLLTGTNTDEGTSFSPSGPNSEHDLFNLFLYWRSYALSPPTILKLLELYPNDPCNEPPFYITNCSVFSSKGLQWRRGAAIGGDLVMHSGRRKMCEQYTLAGQDVYSYRFDTRLWNKTELAGIAHFDNVAFSFQNISGLLGPSPEYDSDMKIARAVGTAYIRFVNTLNPNQPSTYDGTKISNIIQAPHWPKYVLNSPENMVFNATHVFVEADTWRKEGISFMNTYEVARELLA
ncbi:putative carboxylesterase family protein [Phaeoacremonium minimum UCRPA7]|uniref:Carboxylic ester hydrolase n=1 Tax=Phaeoacremonium minimum (strain UCR-PA7) TaxID=1286976 RepID=R8BKI7_PHAM7|nr:putative carboxylesterase family protein [Phaeoacremonium minimum UCRPA7]EON99732.1 putative carboxylesterase family protein [Phaeoacremonium minimum UCRPA7]